MLGFEERTASKKGKDGEKGMAKKRWRGKGGKESLCFQLERKGKVGDVRTARKGMTPYKELGQRGCQAKFSYIG